MMLQGTNTSSCLDLIEVLDGLPIAVRIEDFSKALRMIGAVDDLGRSDIHAFLHNRRDGLRRLLAGIEVTYANAATFELYRASNLAALSNALGQLRSSKPYAELYADILRARAEAPERVESEHELRFTPSNSVIVRSVAYWAGSGGRRPTNVIWIEQDITQHKTTEAQLRLSEVRLKAVVAHAPVAMTLEDLDGHVLLANPKATDLFGPNDNGSDGLARRPSSDVGPAPMLSAISHQVLQSRRQVHKEIEVSSAGRLRKVDLIKFPISTGEDDLFAIGMVGTDVTEERKSKEEVRRLAEELARAERRVTVGQMSIALSHELSQPLAAIHNYARSAIRSLRAAPEELSEPIESLDRICGQAERASEIIRNLRSFLDKHGPHITNFDIDPIVRSVVELATSSIDCGGINIEFELAGGLPMVRASRIFVEQAILNLVTNAAEALRDVAAEERRLRIRTATGRDGVVEIGITDTGPGVPADLRHRIFEPFFTTKPDGTGLGLSICRTLIEQVGGSVSAQLDGAKGATFILHLARADS